MAATASTSVFGSARSLASLIARLGDRFDLPALGRCTPPLAASLFAALLFTACGDHGTSGSKAVSADASATDIQSTVNRLRMPAPEPNAPFLPLSGVVLDGPSADLPELAKARDAVLAAEGRTIQALVLDMRAKSRNATKLRGATMNYKGEGGGVVLTGGGAYTVDGIESGNGPLTLTAKPSGCVDGPSFHNGRQTVEVVTLTPTD